MSETLKLYDNIFTLSQIRIGFVRLGWKNFHVAEYFDDSLNDSFLVSTKLLLYCILLHSGSLCQKYLISDFLLLSSFKLVLEKKKPITVFSFTVHWFFTKINFNFWHSLVVAKSKYFLFQLTFPAVYDEIFLCLRQLCLPVTTVLDNGFFFQFLLKIWIVLLFL